MACLDCVPQTTPCVSTDACTEVCADNLGTKCITSSEDVGAPLNVESGETLDSIIRKINVLISSLSPASFADFEYGCLSTQGIETEEQFVEFVASLLCQIIGTQSPGALTSLSDLNALIQQLLTDVGAIKTQSVIGCFQTTASLPASTTLTNLLTSIQQILCNHAAFIATFSSPNITVNNTNKSVILAAAGLQNHTLSADVNIQVDPNQALIQNGDGTLFVPAETPITINPHTTTNVSATGTAGHTLQVAAKISPNAGNQLLDDGAGLFVPASSLSETALVATDSSSIDFSTSGISGHNLTGAVKIDPAPTNLLSVTGSGLLLDSSSVPSGAQTPIAAGDTQSIDMNASGVDNHTLSASVKINPTTDNPIYIAANGLDYDDIKAITRIVNNPTALGILCSAVAACALPAVAMSCGSATVPTFTVATVGSGSLSIPVVVTNSGNITITANGTGISGLNTVAVTPATTSISVLLNYDGSSPSGNRPTTVNITGVSGTSSCIVNVPINPSSNIEMTSTLASTSVTNVTGISGYVFSGPLNPGGYITGTHTGGVYNVSVTITGPPAVNGNIRIYRNGVSLECINVPTAGSYPSTVVFSSHTFVVGDLLALSLSTGTC